MSERFLAVAAAALMFFGAILPPGTTRAAGAAPADEAGVTEAVNQWISALNAMVAGDPEPFAALFSHSDDVIYMSGEGTYRIGWDATWADWKEQAAKSLGGHVVAGDIHTIIAGDIATVGLVANATVTMPDGSSKQLRVRQTTVFRKEGGSWKLVAHHADNLPVWTAIVDGK